MDGAYFRMVLFPCHLNCVLWGILFCLAFEKGRDSLIRGQGWMFKVYHPPISFVVWFVVLCYVIHNWNMRKKWYFSSLATENRIGKRQKRFCFYRKSFSSTLCNLVSVKVSVWHVRNKITLLVSSKVFLYLNKLSFLAF